MHIPAKKKIWQGINAIIGKKKIVKLTKNVEHIAEDLLLQYSLTSTYTNLPHDIKVRLDEKKFDREMKIEIACAETYEADRFVDWITQSELDIALSHGKSSAPGEDGITYQTIRLLNDTICDGINPIKLLFSAVYKEGLMPWQWKYSIIVPIPKKDSDKLRPISLTSCLCKVFERVILNRLKFTLDGKLSYNLYGFMNGKSTKDCFIEYMDSESQTHFTTFLDLKSAFDIANRTVILEHLATLGIKGKLLEIIRNYFSDRYSKVLYKGYLTPVARRFDLGTPQGGVLSPFLFNILMDKLVKSMQLPNNKCKIICYADDLCIKAPTLQDMQTILNQISTLTKELGLIVSISKTKFLATQDDTDSLTFDEQPLDSCSSYNYLGIPTPPPVDFVKTLCKKLSQRLRPLRVLANRVAGINILICKKFYIAYIRSLIDYHALHLCTLSNVALRPLETLQNKALRIILGCPLSTRIIAMRQELDIPPICDHIKQSVILFGVKTIKSFSAPETTETVPNSVTYAPATLKSLVLEEVAYDKKLHHKTFGHISKGILKHNVNLLSEHDPKIQINPTERVKATVHLPVLPNKIESSPVIQKACWFEAFETVVRKSFSSSPHIQIYTDGSSDLTTGKSGYGVVAYHSISHTETYNASVPQPKWTTNYECELQALKLAVKYVVTKKLNALIVCDSKSALLSINACRPNQNNSISVLQKDLIYCAKNQITVEFIWAPSHVGIKGNERADKLAKEGAKKPAQHSEVLGINQFRALLNRERKDEMRMAFESELVESISMTHYANFKDIRHLYGRGKALSGPCDRLAARIRLGYRKLWEIDLEKKGWANEEYSKCKLCGKENSNNLLHYISFCEKLEPFRPKNLKFHELCVHFCNPENLIPILVIFPGFTM